MYPKSHFFIPCANQYESNNEITYWPPAWKKIKYANLSIDPLQSLIFNAQEKQKQDK